MWLLPVALAAPDPWLLSLLDPPVSSGELADFSAESAAADLTAAEVRLDGTVLSGHILGNHLEKNGAWLVLDLSGGPAPDLRLGVGKGWVRAAPVLADGWSTGPSMPLVGTTTLKGDRLDFRVDLLATGRVEAGHAGAVTALVSDGVVEDTGPGGSVGPPISPARAVWEGMQGEDLGLDPDLALAVALDFGIWYARVQPQVQPIVLEDARGWYRYGAALDGWLQSRGLPWRLRDQSPLAKLLWAWPGGQTVIYGAMPLAFEQGAMDEARYRFHVLAPQLLPSLRDNLPVQADLWGTAQARDTFVWQHLRYRGPEGAMRALCRNGVFTPEECKGWLKEVADKKNLGSVDGVTIPLEGGVSAAFQWERYQHEQEFVGDCATATSLSMAAYQAVGLVPLAAGYAGPDWNSPTHEQPFVLDGSVFLSTQTGPSPTFARENTYAYVILPLLHPVHSLSVGWEPGGWARGGAVAGGWMWYGVLARQWENGISLESVGQWLETQWNGGWPGL